MIRIGGVELALRFDLAALRRIEQAIGDFSQAANLITTADGVSLLLWACLATRHPDIAREELDRRLGVGDLGRVRAALTAAMEEAFGEGAFDIPFGAPIEGTPDIESG